jgi:hypothetical protein
VPPECEVDKIFSDFNLRICYTFIGYFNMDVQKEPPFINIVAVKVGTVSHQYATCPHFSDRLFLLCIIGYVPPNSDLNIDTC